MPFKDPRIDTYIKKAQPFAQPVLRRMRSLVHKACPSVTETIKWGMPGFDYNGPMFSMASFKHHCVGGFWKTKLLNDPDGYLSARKNQGGEAMGNLGRMTSLKDLPPEKVFINFVRQHMRLNAEGVRLPKKPVVKKKLVVSREMAAALNKNKKAKSVFDNFSLSHQREYAEWVAEAKTEPTREKRIRTTIEWLSEGKPRNWKYM